MGSGEVIEFLSDVAIVLPNTPLAERAIALKAKLTTTPEPAGETVRVRAGVWAEADGSGWKVQGWHNWEPLHCVSEPIAIIEADIPLPRIPTVAARVVEGKE
jgi:hypothetical protein